MRETRVAAISTVSLLVFLSVWINGNNFPYQPQLPTKTASAKEKCHESDFT
jgi:hypothetical protein